MGTSGSRKERGRKEGKEKGKKEKGKRKRKERKKKRGEDSLKELRQSEGEGASRPTSSGKVREKMVGL